MSDPNYVSPPTGEKYVAFPFESLSDKVLGAGGSPVSGDLDIAAFVEANSGDGWFLERRPNDTMDSLCRTIPLDAEEYKVEFKRTTDTTYEKQAVDFTEADANEGENFIGRRPPSR